MKVLVVYAHPNPQSFNHAILEQFTKGLTDGGHTFEVVDLHAIKFDPCIQLEDLAQFTGGQMPRDVLDQQEKLAQAEALACIYPITSWTFPAILKGWFDRVFSFGFAYKADANGWHALLKQKKALLMCTTAVPETMYKDWGIKDLVIKTNEVNLHLAAGIQKVEHVYFHSPGFLDAEGRKKYLESAYQLGKEF